MSDPAPEGYVSVRIAFKRYCSCHKPGDDALLHLGPFIALLKSGSLRTIVRDPDRGERFSVPPEAWGGAWYVERPILADEISGSEGDGFKPYVGRTPFVAESQLAPHLFASTIKPFSRRRGKYPWDACRAAFNEKVAEDGAPTVDGGELGWRTQADAIRWVQNWMMGRLDSETQPSWSTTKDHVASWLNQLWPT